MALSDKQRKAMFARLAASGTLKGAAIGAGGAAAVTALIGLSRFGRKLRKAKFITSGFKGGGQLPVNKAAFDVGSTLQKLKKNPAKFVFQRLKRPVGKGAFFGGAVGFGLGNVAAGNRKRAGDTRRRKRLLKTLSPSTRIGTSIGRRRAAKKKRQRKELLAAVTRGQGI